MYRGQAMAILFDLDGVFYRGDEVIPGAATVAEWARDSAVPHLFVTNTTSRPRNSLVDKLAGFGIATDTDHILTPPVAAVQWCRRHLGARAAVVYVAETTRAEFAALRLADDDVGAVIVGDLGREWTFDRLNDAFRHLMHSPPPALIALGMTRYWQTAHGMQLDVGPFVAALAYASGVEPVVLGKPAPAFFQAALDLLGSSAQETLMVGDDIRGDVEGALKVGMRALLVRTGKFRDTDLQLGIEPTGVIDSVRDLPDWCARTSG